MTKPHPGTGGQASGKRSGTRQKHVPQRTCIVCRDTGAKRSLTRLVRTGDGVVEVDPGGRLNGRGAYLCDKQACWDRAVSTPILARALRTTPSEESLNRLKEFAARATLTPASDGAAADSKE